MACKHTTGGAIRQTKTVIVHLRRRGGVEVEGCDVYIGRAMYQGGWRLPTSKWANPYRLCDFENSRAAVLAAYEKHIRATPELLAALHELEGKRLGCWCVEGRCLTCGKARGGACGHLDCHGDVLVKLLHEKNGFLEAGAVQASRAPRCASPMLAEDAETAPNKKMGASIIQDDDPIWAELGLAEK